MSYEPITSESMEALVTRALNSTKGIRIQFPTKGAAINWRQRYYKVRARKIKNDSSHEWRLMSANLAEINNRWYVEIIPTDAQVLSYPIEEIT